MNHISPRIDYAADIIARVAQAISKADEKSSPEGVEGGEDERYLRMAAAAVTEWIAMGALVMPPAQSDAREIYIQWSNNLQHIRRWSFDPFDLAERILVEAVVEGQNKSAMAPASQPG